MTQTEQIQPHRRLKGLENIRIEISLEGKIAKGDIIDSPFNRPELVISSSGNNRNYKVDTVYSGGDGFSNNIHVFKKSYAAERRGNRTYLTESGKEIKLRGQDYFDCESLLRSRRLLKEVTS